MVKKFIQKKKIATKKLVNELKKLKKSLRQKDHFLTAQKKLTKAATHTTVRAVKELKNETKKHVVTAIVAAFGFIIALVWRDAIKEFIESLVINFSITGPPSLITLYTAIITTIIAAIGIVLVTKWSSEPETKK